MVPLCQGTVFSSLKEWGRSMNTHVDMMLSEKKIVKWSTDPDAISINLPLPNKITNIYFPFSVFIYINA